MAPRDRQTDRAQTTLDFAIAMSVFLVAAAFVFTFIPSLTAPFVDGNQEQSAIADRVASNLVEGSLADPTDPYILNMSCTTEFFNETALSGCGYPATPSDYRNRTGLSDRPAVNVSLVAVNATTRERTPLCYDHEGEDVVNRSDAACDTTDVVYQVGGDPSGAQSVTVARRIVSVDGSDATLFVRVW